MKKFVAIIAVVMSHFAVGQVPNLNSCPEVQVVEEFNVTAYLGNWYEYEKYPFIFSVGKCVSAQYGILDDGNISVINSQYDKITNNRSEVQGFAKILGPGRLRVKFPKGPALSDKPNYLVLGSDYQSYAVVFSCTELKNILHISNLWILTRDRQPSEDVVKNAYSVLDKNNLSLEYLTKTDQTDCH